MRYMSRARFRDARSIWLGAMFLCAASALSTTVVHAAPRRALGPLRRTAQVPTNETNDTANRARRSTEASRVGSRAEKRGAKVDATSSVSNSKAPIDGKGAVDGKLLADPKLADPTKGEGAARGADARSDSRGNVDARPAGKAPIDLPSPSKSSVEKFGAEVGAVARERGATDLGDTSRPSDTRGAAPVNGASVPPNGAVPANAGATAGSATSTAGVSAGSASSRPASLMLEGPVFDGGDVPKAAASLERMKGAFTRCASIETALTKNEGSFDLRFLVRAPGRAEGVGAETVRGVSGDVVRCVTSVLARSYIGAPSDDPVGVGVTVRVRKD